MIFKRAAGCRDFNPSEAKRTLSFLSNHFNLDQESRVTDYGIEVCPVQDADKEQIVLFFKFKCYTEVSEKAGD